ncbi:unnamed protein product [Durusdinium trenchii]|uniref:Asparagine synthase (glutamine-hydrolyzing) n=1 Tax=Durusdinium trenchii TaxID=1381693 RepID=A0ABP0L6I8_9DINO
MCGLAFWLRFKSKIDWKDAASIFPEALAEEDAFEAAVAVLPRRGPDAQGTEVVDLPDAHLELQACVLHLRGEAVTAQPCPVHEGGQLLFNGEIYESSRGGSDSLDLSSSDTCWLARQLANCEVISDGADKLTLALRDLLETLHGPFAMAFWSPKCHALFVARDRLGRRSLLAARTASGVGVASVGSSVSWQELPVTGVFVFDLVARSVRQLPWRQPAPFAQPWWWSTDNACDEANLRLAFGRLLSEAVARRVEHVAGAGIRVGLLFSGGLDSTVLAALAAEALPHETIELINVAFDSRAPDRLTALCSFQEDLLAEEISICRLLGPKATHLDFNIAAALWFAARGRGLLCSPDFVSQPWWAPTAASSLQLEPSKPVKPAGPSQNEKVSCVTCVLPAKPGCPHLSCKLCCRKLHKASGEPKEWCPVHKIKAPSAEQPEAEPEAEVCIELSAQRCAHPEAEEIRASCRVLLVGTGADELLGGYSRHRTARAKRGADGTRSEMLKDLQRLWTRNLGRDDRIIADHGREARHPFLDDHLLEFVGRLPIELVAYGIGGESDPAPDKWLLRELASQRGLDACAQFKKRAIQFGTRIAKKSNIQHAGSNRQVRGDMAYSALSEKQPQQWAVERGPGWPPGGLRGPPNAWMGNAPPPWHVPGPPPGSYPPPEAWRPYPGPPPSQPPPRRGRLERNDGGGVSIVVMQVPPSLNKMDVLNEYFGRFGPVSSLQINQMRHEAIVTFSRMEDAEEALRFPVLNDPSIGLRPWRPKAGQRAPDDVPGESATSIANAPVVPSIPIIASGNMTLESASVLEAKRKREELQDRRKALLSSLTDQLKQVLARINDPSTSDRNREQLQTILANIKDKINALTPVQKEDPAKRRPMPMRPLPYQTTLDNRPRPAVLQLSKLPEEMRGPDGEVQLRDALGDSVEWIREWSEDGSSCMVRFRDRRQAEAAIQDQKVWGFVAKIQDEAPHFRRKPPVHRFQPTRHMHKVFRPPRMVERAPGSPETEAFDSDIEDPDLLASMREEPQEVQEEAHDGEEPMVQAREDQPATAEAEEPEVPLPPTPLEPDAQPSAPSELSAEPVADTSDKPAEDGLPESGPAEAAPATAEQTQSAATDPAPSEVLEPLAALAGAAEPSEPAHLGAPEPAEPAEPVDPAEPAETEPAQEDAAVEAPAAETPALEASKADVPKGAAKPTAKAAKAKASQKAKAEKAQPKAAKAKAKVTAAKASSTRGRGRGRG